MSGHVRPHVSWSRIAPYALLLAVGLIALFVVFGPDTFIVRGAPDTRVGDVALRDFSIEKQGTLWKLVSSGFAMSLVTVSLYELIRLGVQYVLWFFSKRRLLNAFFGDRVGEHAEDGEIIAQSDPLKNMLQDLVDDCDARLEAVRKHRLYKARHWVDRYDIEGGRAILKLFRNEGLAIPNFRPVDRRRASASRRAPFKIALGMGFTDEAERLKSLFAQWLDVEVTAKYGDALSIHQLLLPKSWELKLDAEPHAARGDMRSLRPRGWSIEKWLDAPEDVHDYAFILRHEMTVTSPADACVYFWLGGFTDRGTAAAGRYLAANWEALHRRFVRQPFLGAKRAERSGNFLIVIEGLSNDVDPNRSSWKEIDGFAVTPADLAKIGRQWAALAPVAASGAAGVPAVGVPLVD